jgi:hypothetical protein
MSSVLIVLRAIDLVCRVWVAASAAVAAGACGGSDLLHVPCLVVRWCWLLCIAVLWRCVALYNRQWLLNWLNAGNYCND